MARNSEEYKTTTPEMIEARDEALPALLGDEFIINPELRKGSTDSAHGVVFGHHEQYGDVAAKTFAGLHASERARNEEDMMKAISDMGFISLKPIVVVESEDLTMRAVLLTEYEEGLDSLNTFSLDAAPSTPEGAAIEGAVSNIAYELGALHGQNVSHGDPQTKNFAYKRGGEGKPVIYDLEGSQKHSTRTDRGAELFRNRAIGDLDRFTRSLGRRQFGGASDEQAKKHFGETVVEPYLAGAGNVAGRQQIEEAAIQAGDTLAEVRSYYRDR